MKIRRTCPACCNVTTMEIPDFLVESNDYWNMGAVEGKFFKYGYCKKCQDVIYTSRKELEREDNEYDTLLRH